MLLLYLIILINAIDVLGININDYFLFTFVRNPYSWILSVWNNFYRYPRRYYPQNIINNSKTVINQILESI
ncbi:hypothetical protein GM3709_1428 [Geminocystis sp. NIES-3709]|nr:hypothetical protein GM3709_1428 [Geminocystis sp. NIES-3709]